MTAGIDFTHACGPDGVRVYAIGDVHGRFDLLLQMHGAISSDLAAHATKDWRIIHLGDYVDRGPDSRSVLDMLVKGTRDPRMVALAGNHDLAFLEFLATPDPASLFALYGGRQTAQSYGVETSFEPALIDRTHRDLVRAVPRSHGEFLGGLAFAVTLGDFFFCHAGIRPGVELDAQDSNDLVWIRGEFHRFEGLHPKLIVHGHTPVAQPEIRANRVNLDTGAFQSGTLSAIVIDGPEKTILQVSDRPI